MILTAASAQAQSKGEAEARRQLDFARQEVQQHNYEKALVSADSALRLDPSLYAALLYKAESYEGLGNLRLAESMALSYFELSGLRPGGDATADEVLARIQRKLAAGTVAADEPVGAKKQSESMPPLPRGSEDFLRWLIERELLERARIRRDVGGALLGGGGALLGTGAVLMGVASARSAEQPFDANTFSAHAAGLGVLCVGGAIVASGLPLLFDGAARSVRAEPGSLAWLPGGALGVRF